MTENVPPTIMAENLLPPIMTQNLQPLTVTDNDLDVVYANFTLDSKNFELVSEFTISERPIFHVFENYVEPNDDLMDQVETNSSIMEIIVPTPFKKAFF